MKSILSKMRLYNETDIMGILFYLISRNERLKASIFRSMEMDEEIFENSNLNLYQEYSLEGCRADAYFELHSRSSISRQPAPLLVKGVIEAKLHGSVSEEQLEGYRRALGKDPGFNYLVTLIPKAAIPMQMQNRKPGKGFMEVSISWEMVRQELSRMLKEHPSEFCDIERTMAELLVEFIEYEIEARDEFARFHQDLIQGCLTGGVNAPSYLRRCIQSIGAHFETMFPNGSRLEVSDGKWMGRRLESQDPNGKVFWFGMVNVAECEPALAARFKMNTNWFVLLSKTDRPEWETVSASRGGYWKAVPEPELVLWRKVWGGPRRSLIISASGAGSKDAEVIQDLLSFMNRLMRESS